MLIGKWFQDPGTWATHAKALVDFGYDPLFRGIYVNNVSCIVMNLSMNPRSKDYTRTMRLPPIEKWCFFQNILNQLVVGFNHVWIDPSHCVFFSLLAFPWNRERPCLSTYRTVGLSSGSCVSWNFFRCIFPKLNFPHHLLLVNALCLLGLFAP